MKVARTVFSIAMLAISFVASAQITAAPALNPTLNNNLFPRQNALGPTGDAQQVNYPYEGQCVTSQAMKTKYFPLLPLCTLANAPSFACDTVNPAVPGYTAGGWGTCGAASIAPPVELWPNLPAANVAKFQYEVLNPPAYSPDKLTFPGADYYELQLHEAWGYDFLRTVPVGRGTVFPNPGVAVPNGKQWTGLTCSPAPGRTTCTGGVAIGQPLFTPVWGVGSKKNFLGAAGTPSSWSLNDYVATWPSVSVWAKKGTPVVVKWINEFPDQHVFCPHPEAADWPCAIDRTFMGVKAVIDPALANATVSPEGVNKYGSPQQPDNSWVTHLHGGDIPPSTDGFAEKWFGNKNSAVAYAGLAGGFVTPPFENPLGRHLKRPVGNADTYTYPMIQDEATIWFHDHTLGKTHHNVIAGPAGFFPVVDDARHAAGGDLAWLNEMTVGWASAQNVDGLGAPLYDVFLAIQDRAFNDDGSINFSNGLGQTLPVGVLPPAIGYSSVTAGANPQVHPVWVPEYFGEYAVVNGVLWPKKTVDRGWYRLRLVDGSDSRCWTIGLTTVTPLPGKKPTNNVPYFVLANDQGYLLNPVKLDPLISPAQVITMCPGERYELLVDFSAFPAGTTVTMTNTAGAPFPAGITPFAQGSPFAHLNVIMQFVVAGTPLGVPVTAANNPAFVNPALKTMTSGASFRAAPVNAVRQIYLNEKVDGVTLAPLGMQLNGVPFEYKVTETPKNGTVEKWQFINLTVDAHPMHPHLVKHQIISRQPFNVGAYKALLCGSATCQPGPAPGNEMQVVPDVTPLLQAGPALVLPTSFEGGWKDASQAPPGMVTTIIAKWEGAWEVAGKASLTPNAPGTAGGLNAVLCNPNPICQPIPATYVGPTAIDPVSGGTCMCTPDLLNPLICANPLVLATYVPQATQTTCGAASWTYEGVSSGPYVWHCHINSHEDSEMMRTSLVIP